MRQLYGAGHGGGQWQAAKALGQRGPRGGCAGHGHGQRAVLGHLGVAQGGDFVQRHAHGRRAAGVQAVHLALVPHQRKGIAAYAIGRGFHHGERGSGGNGRINGVAARLKHIQAGLRGQRLRSGHHAALGVDRVAARGVGVVQSVEIKHKNSLLTGVQGVAQTVAQQVERKDQQENRQTRPHGHPGGVVHVVFGGVEHAAPAGRGRLLTQA